MNTLSTKRIEQIARNINAMEIEYVYYDDIKSYRFWFNLKMKLDAILESLSNADKQLVAALCNDEKRKYFKLV